MLPTEPRIFMFYMPYSLVALAIHAALFYIVATLGIGDATWPWHLGTLAGETRFALASGYATTAVPSVVIGSWIACEAADSYEQAARQAAKEAEAARSLAIPPTHRMHPETIIRG